MDSQSEHTWPQAGQAYQAIGAIGEQDFSDFIDLDLDMGALQFSGIYGSDGGNNNAKGSESIDQHLRLLQSQHAQQHAATLEMHGVGEQTNQAGNIFDFDMPMNFEPQQHQSAFAMPQQGMVANPHSIIPPTPNSVEMHGDASRYLQHLDAQSRLVLEQHYQLRKGDAVNFTPLVSPAVTPHENRFQLSHDYTVNPAAYFSPLTSPALEGQQQVYPPNGSTGSVATASPADLDIDMLDGPAAPQDPIMRRTARKKAQSPRVVANGNRVKQSPITKPQQRRKGNLSAVIPPKEVQEILSQAQGAQASPTSPSTLRPSYSRPSSGSESISPEPGMESLMGPPPRPGSAKASPAITAQHGPTSSPRLAGQPATPASLMRIQQRSSGSPGISPLGQSMANLMAAQSLDELTLPEAATVDVPMDGDATPRLSAKKLHSRAPASKLSSLATSANTSAQSTPLASAVTSPTSSVMSPLSGRKPELKPRGNKKRGSVSNNSMVSPALRPKISPSIKPLLPEGATLTDEAHTLFLANRSNYQNLIEGTHVPGVSYPTELSTNLTSKRTSHKIAEQGRRNRINLALQEMLSLLPRGNGMANINLDGDDDDDKGGKGGKNSGSSKAATVESAIDYIRTLQHESRASKQAMEEKDREVADLRKKLGDMQKQLGSATAVDHNSADSSSESTTDGEMSTPGPDPVDVKE